MSVITKKNIVVKNKKNSAEKFVSGKLKGRGKALENKTVLICKDVLKSIRYLDVQTGSYINISNVESILNKKIEEGEEYQKYFKLRKIQEKCRVCALGACFVSHIKLFDKFKATDGTLLSNTRSFWDSTIENYTTKIIFVNTINQNFLLLR